MNYERMDSADLHQALRDFTRRAVGADDTSDRLLYELQVHQIELEMQNREMRDTRGELEASRDRYARLYDFAPVALCTLDNRGLILDLNLTATRLFGREREFLRRLPITVFLKDDAARLWQLLGECAATGERARGIFRLSLGARVIAAEFICAPAENEGASKGGRVFEVAIIDSKSGPERITLVE